jgi:hypothetical protein
MGAMLLLAMERCVAPTRATCLPSKHKLRTRPVSTAASTPPVLVAGGGIGGLATALALSRVENWLVD